MIRVLDLTNKDLIAIQIDGHLDKSDYEKITPLIEKTVKEYEKIKLYIQIDNIDGIEPKAFAEDVKTYFKHYNHMNRIAVVGENDWQKLWANLANPFVSGEIKFFRHGDVVAAQKWILG